MFFAGLTSVIAKKGRDGICGDVGLTVRTGFVFVLVIALAAKFFPSGQYAGLTRVNLAWLGLSGITSALSWIFYDKTHKQGEVSSVVLIDEGCFVVAVALAWLFLGETITPRIVAGSGLILAVLAIVARR